MKSEKLNSKTYYLWMDNTIMLKKVIDRIKLEIQCFMVDHTALRMLVCVTCFELFPPSFYLRHSEEEARRIMAEEKEKLLEYIESL